MKKYLKSMIVLSALTVALTFSVLASADDAEVNWLTIEEAQERFQEEPRMIFVDVYTSWCGWCRRMTSETYTHPRIAQLLNAQFYPVKLNAEQEEPIIFQGVTYENENIGQRRATHNFAIALLQGRMSYPSVAFFDENFQLITAIPGFRPPKAMEGVLTFFKDGVFKENPDLDSFLETFEGTITD
jgi:thioredoxin-related protein